MSRRLRVVVAVLAFFCPAAASSASAQTIIVKAARLIDGRGGAPLEPAMVRIVGDHIEQVAATLPVPAGARLIDLGSATLLPGLIDLHTHLTDRDDVHWETALTTTTPPEAALWGARNARVTLMAGVTTCRDMGPTWPYVDVELRKAIEAGAVPGPRMLVAGNYVSSTGGAGDARQFSIYLDVPFVRNLADGPDEIVKAVRTNFKYGADFIKILVDGRRPVEGHHAGRAAVFRRGNSGGRHRGDAVGPPGRRARAWRRRHQGGDSRRACGRSTTDRTWMMRRSRC